jgi:hypothetical protein
VTVLRAEARQPTARGRAGALLALGMTMLLAGCIIPQVHPFQPDHPLPSQLPQAESQPSYVAVGPVAGIAEPLASELGQAMALSLLQHSLPAEFGQMEGAVYEVHGRLRRDEAGEAALVWDLEDDRGRIVARASQPLPPGDPSSKDNADAVVAAVAGDPANVIAQGIEGDAPSPRLFAAAPPIAAPASPALKPGTAPTPKAGAPEATLPPSPPPAAGQPTTGTGKPVRLRLSDEAAAPSHKDATGARPDSIAVTVLPTKGLPSDGEATLQRAIAYALSVAKLDIVEADAPSDLSLVGKIELTKLGDGVANVKVSWSLRRHDGSEIGQVNQENNLREGVIERAWGEIAAAVSNNAADGIAQLVKEAQTKPE